MTNDCFIGPDGQCVSNLVVTEFQILDWIAGFHNSFLDAVLPVISTFGDKGIGWIILSIILLCIPKYRKAGLAMALALIFCLLIGNITLKPLIARPRPYSYFPEMQLLIPPLSDYSFPSGHTFASFASATALFLHHRKEGTAAYLLAAVIAFSRMYLYVHFPTDILAGIILGVASGFTAFKLISWYHSRYQPRWLNRR
ncbi:MAG: phosphatase PAP2 family protein [Peptococcaceae bacterium]|jgi:undecaprenyl-diphosphatase|nr:phosphatase PAP2 family protein [Peptococcaceae bacterium]